MFLKNLISRAVAQVIEKQNRFPAGAPGRKGGQFAPSSFGSMGGGAGAGPQFKTFPVNSPSGGFYPGEQPAPPPPPKGAKPHPKADDKGKAVTVNYPTRPSDASSWTDPKRTATFVPGGAVPAKLNGVAVKPWADAPSDTAGWAKVPGQKPELDENNPFEGTQGKSIGAGVIVREPDGRIWLTRPTNSFGGYVNTFPKGTVEQGLGLQASAIKEAYEETGLQVRITGVLGDYERTTSKARFYVAERVGGSPAEMGWESQAIRLAPPKDMAKLLNMKVDRDILDDLLDNDFLKQAPAKGGKTGAWVNQKRWPSGTPLGGQWMAMGADGLTLPPTIAGGLGAANPQFQKQANALHAMAQGGDKKGLADTVKAMGDKVAANAAAGKSTSKTKWTAQVHQFGAQLVTDMGVVTKAEAKIDAIKGPMKLGDLAKVSPKPGGSNPGYVMTDDGKTNWLVKGNASQDPKSNASNLTSDIRAANEVVAARLMLAAGVGAPEMRLVDLGGMYNSNAKGPGNLGVASKMMDGLVPFNSGNPAHVAAARADFAVHAWLGNWDVLGASYDNTMIDKTGKAVCIDTGGAMMFRAQGAPKKAGEFGKDAADFETMRSTHQNQVKIYGGMTKSQLADSAAKLALVSDDTIKTVVHSAMGKNAASDDLVATLIARRDAVMAKAGVKPGAAIAGDAKAVEPVPAPKPPRLAEAVPAPRGKAGVAQKPDFATGLPSDKYYTQLATKAEALHAAGNLDQLKTMPTAQKGGKGNSAGKTWEGKTINSAKLVAYHQALIADLEQGKTVAETAVAQGKATVKGADGTTWAAKDGVLEPVAAGGVKALTTDHVARIASANNFSSLDEKANGAGFAATQGNLVSVKAWKPTTAEGKATKAALIAAMTGGATAPAAVAAAPAAPDPKPAGPNFSAFKIPDTNQNAPSHNAKVDAIAAAHAAGDAKSILAMNYGTNTYGKKQAQLANDALAAMGSAHQVEVGQKKNSHPALIGGSAQPVAATVAVQPPKITPKTATKRSLSDLSPDKLPSPPDIMNYNGAGKPYSSKDWKNKANAEALDALKQAALTGGVDGIDAVKFPELDPNTGAPTGKMLLAQDHPSKKIVVAYAIELKDAVNDFLNPPKDLSELNTISAASVAAVASQLLSKPIGQTVAAQSTSERFGFWVAMGKVDPLAPIKPASYADITPTQKKAGAAAYSKYSSLTKSYVSLVQQSGAINRAIDEGKAVHAGIDLKAATKAVYADATPLPAGATLYRWQNMPAGMLKQLEKAPVGLAVQSFGGMCTSISPTATSHFGKHRVTIRAAAGAKAIHSHGSGGFSSEQEITTIPGQRFVLLDKKKNTSGNWEIELLMLPPDENFLK